MKRRFATFLRAVTAFVAVSIIAQTAPTAPTSVEGLKPVKKGGIQYWDITVGTGATAGNGKMVTLNYTGWLTDGKKFDSSFDHGKPFTFKLGDGKVIPGWDEGVKGMKVGGKRQLRIPPDMGYGAQGAGKGVIPPNATLVFDVELLNVG